MESLYHAHVVGDLILSRYPFSSNWCRFNTIPIKIQVGIFVEIESSDIDVVSANIQM